MHPGSSAALVRPERRAEKSEIERALAEKPDIIAIPESFTLANLQNPDLEQRAEDLDSPTLDMACAYARQNRTYKREKNGLLVTVKLSPGALVDKQLTEVEFVVLQKLADQVNRG